ncbi:MAG: chemotaxis protein CheX [Chloroflexi bacterium]|nr:chemotaxis protein CheX [Anaerolineaceae bacterium]NMB86831.1 chemotaxis protein CheX [Chloroflexota bacterium]
MNVKFMNPFIEAAIEVLNAEVNVKVVRGNLALQSSALTADDITVLINLVGEIQGVVLFGMSVSTALGLVSQIMEQKFTELDSLAQSGIAELGNVISGAATIKMSATGYNSTISPPTLIVGNGAQISTLDFARIVVPLQTELGNIVVHLALRESPAGQKGVNFVPLIQSAVGGNLTTG